MNRCHLCGKTLDEIPFECRRCGYIFCSSHHLPESHDCSGIKPAFTDISKPVVKKQTRSINGRKIRNGSISCGAILLLIVACAILYGVIFTGMNPTAQTVQTSQTFQISHPVQSPKPVLNQTALEYSIHELINQQRTSHGLSSLRFDQALVRIARKHSADMAKNNYFEHIDLQGLNPTGRGYQAGYSCYKDYGLYYTNGIAENIFQNNLYHSMTYYGNDTVYNWNTQEEIAQSTVNGWMNSTGHRQNILTSKYDREGIGVAIAADSEVYITEDFC